MFGFLLMLVLQKSVYIFQVKKMRSSLEFVKFDEEDKGGIETSARGFYPYGVRPSEKDHTFYLCYYVLQGKRSR